MRNKIKTGNKNFFKDFVPRTKIKVIGVGGGGGTIINELASNVKNIDFLAVNTDIQALKKHSSKIKKFAFGKVLTKGLGAGMDINIGRLAAEQEKEKVKKILKGVNFCILVSCLGGGTGSGAVPIFAKYAKEMTDIVFGIFTLPFKFEGQKRAKIAQDALHAMMPNLNAVTVIPNDKIFRLVSQDTSLRKSFSIINKSLADNLKGLIELLHLPGLINIDWADIKTVLERKGQIVYLNTSEVHKKDRAVEAVKKVLSNPLYQYKFKGADRILFNISGGKELGMKEVEYISKSIAEFNPQAKIIFGVSHYNKYKNKIKITILATGITANYNLTRSAKKYKKRIERDRKPISLQNISKRTILSGKLVTSKKKIKELKEVKKIKKFKEIKKSQKNKNKKEIEKTKKNKRTKKTKKTEKSHKNKKIIIFQSSRKIKLKKQRDIKKEKQSVKPKLFFSTLLNKKKQKQKKEENIRRNALDLANESRELEEKILAEEERWETPAFLRRKLEK